MPDALTWPIEGREPSREQISPGGWSNDHIAREGGEALDIAVPTGTRVVSLHQGVVTQEGFLGEAGLSITIEWESDGHHYLSRHCHLSKVYWPVGTEEQAGELIGLSGESGKVTGPHLHIVVERDSERVRLEDVWELA